MSLNAISLDGLRSIPTGQKVALLGLLVAAILVGFYFYVVDPKTMELEAVQGQVAQLDTEIQNLTLKVKHLDELVAASKQLEIELAAKKERLPPEEEAVMLLKQVSDLGMRLGLDVRLWKPGTQAEDRRGSCRSRTCGHADGVRSGGLCCPGREKGRRARSCGEAKVRIGA